METVEAEKNASDDSSHLNRNRSFKSKQLVRSQAIRESQSPPRTVSPHEPKINSSIYLQNAFELKNVNRTVINNGSNQVIDNVKNETRTLESDTSSQVSDDRCSEVISDKLSDDDCKRKQPVEIQITPGQWDAEPTDTRARWSRQRQNSRDLLSNNPRVACVCGACAPTACPHCRGRRRKHLCPKQDSGIGCSDECADGSDTEDRRSIDDDQPYCRCPERKEKPKSMSSFSRTDSDDKTEPTGPELVQFIKDTLNKNAKDRVTLLKIEKELHALVNDTGRCIVKFPVMTSYGRMLVHRCATLFQLAHHLDQSTKNAVTVSKSGTCGGRIPCTSFKQWCSATFPPSPHHHSPADTLAKSILKRDTNSLEEAGSGALSASRSKSLEQREREYERVRRRIFSTDNCNSQDESQWPWLNSHNIKLLTPETGRNKLLKVQSLEGNPNAGQAWRGRGAVSKSHSFGGYGGNNPETPPQRLLSRQGDLASSSWRLSPSSSGYRTLSLHSTDSVTPSPTGGASPEPSLSESAVVWCVTDLSAVPPGALLIHPQTGRPLTNPDGSVYHFDPARPPPLPAPAPAAAPARDNKVDQNTEKRRGRLEKQQSFMDNDCECPPEETRSKCCTECHRQDSRNNDKPQPEQKPKPTSPCKKRFESEPTNQKSPIQTNRPSEANQKKYSEPTNQRSYEPNQKQALAFSQSENREYPTNQRERFENQRPASFDGTSKAYEPTNQRPANEFANYRGSELTNQKARQETQELSYVPTYRHEEAISPQVSNPYMPEIVSIQNTLVQAKLTPVAMPDPNIRPMSLTNVLYQSQVPQAYPFAVPAMARIDQPLQPVFQPLVEEQKLAPSPHTSENTFRIDSSYPYAPIEYGAQCGACDANNMQHRSYNVQYSQVEVPQTVLPTGYPVSNVLLPQQHLQTYPYQEPLQWQNLQPMVPVPAAPAPKIYLPDVYPIIQYPQMYPQYNLMYPQVIPQPYPICPPVYPVGDKPAERRSSFSYRQAKRSSVSGSSRNTPQTPDDKKVPYEPAPPAHPAPPPAPPALNRQNSNEIAAKIQQIKEQMAQMTNRDQRTDKPRGEWRRRNSGHGILGSCPPNYNGTLVGRPPNDEAQLTSTARDIVNSIRNMQVKNNYQDRRPDYRPNHERDRRYDKDRQQDREGEERRERRGVVPVPYRPHYLLRQMSPGTWCRRSPGPVHPVLNHPRRPHPDNRNPRR